MAAFPSLTPGQRDRLVQLQEMALQLNAKINLYSEASTHHFWQRHIEHSLTLGIRSFPQRATVVDWGTGGGMPGLPLAILFPEVEFHLIDAVAKKVKAVQTMARRLGLENVRVWHSRAEEWEGDMTHSVSRATAPLATLWNWHERSSKSTGPATDNEWQPGLICLKGGELRDEIDQLQRRRPHLSIDCIPLDSLLSDPGMSEKVIVAVRRDDDRARDRLPQ